MTNGRQNASLCRMICDRSFLSPILLGVGSFLYRKFGSKNLISILSALNSYRRTMKLWNCKHLVYIFHSEINIEGFCQFVFDNFNIHTPDGYNIFYQWVIFSVLFPWPLLLQIRTFHAFFKNCLPITGDRFYSHWKFSKATAVRWQRFEGY